MVDCQNELKKLKEERLAWLALMEKRSVIERDLERVYSTQKIMTNETRYKYSYISSKLGSKKLEQLKTKVKTIQQNDREAQQKYEISWEKVKKLGCIPDKP